MTQLKDMKHPRQPIGFTDEDPPVVRFKGNAIIRWMLKQGEAGRQFDLNSIDTYAFPADDLVQFWQLLGYSVSGYGDLSFIPDNEKDACDAIAEELVAERKSK